MRKENKPGIKLASDKNRNLCNNMDDNIIMYFLLLPSTMQLIKNETFSFNL